MRILYSDEDLVVVNKEKGQLSQKARDVPEIFTFKN